MSPRPLPTALLAALVFACGGCNRPQNPPHADHDHADHTHANHNEHEHDEHEDHEHAAPAATPAEPTEHEDHAHAGHEHQDESAEAGVSYDVTHGLTLAPEVATAIGLRTTSVESRALAAEFTLTAQVFATTPKTLAVARVTPAQADSLAHATADHAQLVQLDRTAATATGLVDAVFALNPAPSSTAGDFVTLTLRLPPVTLPSVPRAALLDTATGAFVYVVNGESCLRTPVTPGPRTAEFVGLTAGLTPGAVVVTAPVEQLWLTELRLTKGGGHSH